jgi:hypothetical protein
MGTNANRFSGLDRFKLRAEPRRAVMGLVVDHELELTEIRIRQLEKVIDIFVILEASITAGKKTSVSMSVRLSICLSVFVCFKTNFVFVAVYLSLELFLCLMTLRL